MDITLTDPMTEDLAICTCCNRTTRAAGGVVRRDGEPWIVYTVHWIPELLPEHGASIRLSFPGWEGKGKGEGKGEGENKASARTEVCLDFLCSEHRSGLFVVNAWGNSVLPGEVHGMTRDEVTHSEFLDHISGVMPSILAQDKHLAELRQLLPAPCVATTGPSQSEYKGPTAAPALTSSAALVSTTAGIDPVMTTAEEPSNQPARLARQNWPRFVRLFNAGEGETYQVKVEFVEGENREELWVLVTALEGDRVRGKVGTEPARVSGPKQMDEVEFGASEVTDWLVIDDGEYFAGGYSIPDDDPGARATRALADQNNLPTMLLHHFLTGLDLSQPPLGHDLASFAAKSWQVMAQNRDQTTKEFSADEVHDAFHADFRQIALWCRSLQVDLWHEGTQKEPVTLELSSDGADGFSAGELLLKIHEAGRPFYSQVGNAYFAGLRFVYINDQSVPVYALMAHCRRSDLSGDKDPTA